MRSYVRIVSVCVAAAAAGGAANPGSRPRSRDSRCRSSTGRLGVPVEQHGGRAARRIAMAREVDLWN
jgi:hypothetical protein